MEDNWEVEYVDIDETKSINKIEEKLYLGSRKATFRAENLRTKGITHVLAVLDSFENYQQHEGITYLTISMYDVWDSNLTQYLPEVLRFISLAINTGKVFIHCQMGVSRSASFVASYLMVKYSISLGPAIKNIRKKRPCVCPNRSFQEQLSLIDVNEYKQYLVNIN